VRDHSVELYLVRERHERDLVVVRKSRKYGIGLVRFVEYFHTPYTGWGMWMGITRSFG
jgi:hypothetical protein